MNANVGEPLVSIVIVTYGTGAIVVDALDAIEQYTPIPHEVIVVDNPPAGSGRRTSELIGSRTDVTLITPDENLGFGGGNNLGAEHARADYICFLNPDVIVSAGWLEPLVAALDDPTVGIAAPAFVDPDGSLQEAGQLLYPDSCTAAVGGPEVLSGDLAQVFSRDVDYSSAACWVVRRSEHLERGGFDPRFHPAYFEDADYALRVELEERRTRLVADVPVVHHHGEGGTIDGDGSSLALGEASQRVFRSIWADVIADRPPRPQTDADAIANRDRLAVDRREFDARSSRPGTEAWRATFAEAVDDARSHPRDRVTLVVTEPLDDAVRHVAAVAGLAVRVVEPEPVGAGSGSSTRHRFVAAAVIGVIAAAGLIVRWLVLRSPAGALTADEAYTGIQSFEILDGQFPVVLGGTAYTLPFEAYLYGPIAAVIGTNVVLLKLLSTLSWGVASIVLFFVGARIASRRVGLVAATLCWLTPGALLLVSVTAYSAYASGMLVAVGAWYLASLVVDAENPNRWAMAGFGALAGFGFWLHPMFLAVLLPLVLAVLWFHRRRPDAWLTVIGGGLLGCAPLLLWNAKNGWPSLETPADVEGTYLERLRTFGENLIPRAFGLRDLALDWQPNAPVGLILYAAVIGLTLFGLVAVVRRSGPRSRVLLPIVLAGVFPIMAMFENLIFANDGRYGIISFPFIIVAMAIGIVELAGRTSAVRAGGVLAVVGLVWLVGFILPTVTPLVDGTDGNPNGHLESAVAALDDGGIDRIYGSYWAVLPVEFTGDRDIVGGVFPFWPIRFPDRQRTVEATPIDEVAIVYLTSDEDPARLPMSVDRYERTVHGDIVLYVPLAGATPVAD